MYWWFSFWCVRPFWSTCSSEPTFHWVEVPFPSAVSIGTAIRWRPIRPSALWQAKIPAINCIWWTWRRSVIRSTDFQTKVPSVVATLSDPEKWFSIVAPNATANADIVQLPVAHQHWDLQGRQEHSPWCYLFRWFAFGFPRHWHPVMQSIETLPDAVRLPYNATNHLTIWLIDCLLRSNAAAPNQSKLNYFRLASNMDWIENRLTSAK